MTAQLLGGTRHSSPLDDEMSYPLTKDEYLTIKDNLLTDKFTNIESFLLTTCITCLISGIVILVTSSFNITVVKDGLTRTIVNYSQVIILIIYGAITLGCFIGYIISRGIKKTSKSLMSRLDEKIMNHLNKQNS